LNVTALCEAVGIERVGFLTLTFAEHVLDPREAQRRMHSLTTGVLRPRYGRAMRVFERQKSGRIHYHLLVTLPGDIRTGCDFAAFTAGDYRSAPKLLRSEWAFWRRTSRDYGFGRTELLPILSTSNAIGRYVGKYIGKHLDAREQRDRGVRLVSYVGPRVASTHFAWAAGNAKTFREKLRAFVEKMHRWGAIEEASTAAMRARFGVRWCHRFREHIFSMEAVS
jgi:hypothetical protein